MIKLPTWGRLPWIGGEPRDTGVSIVSERKRDRRSSPTPSRSRTKTGRPANDGAGSSSRHPRPSRISSIETAGRYSSKHLLRRGAAGADPRAVLAAIRSILGGPELPGLLERAVAYGGRLFPLTVKRVRMVKIEDSAIKTQIGEIAVGALSDDRIASGPSRGTTIEPIWLVRLSPETAVKQVINHRDLTATDYRRLPDLFDRGRMNSEEDGNHFAFFGRFDGTWYKAVIKRTQKNEVFLKTFHKIRPRQLPAGEAKRN